MFHSCDDLDVPVISVCGPEVLLEKFDIQKLVVYVTDLDEKLICQYRILRSTRTNGQIEDWVPSLLCSLWFCCFLCPFLEVTADF